jgi:hypothetical protein
MPTFTEILPATKTSAHRACTWTPAAVGVGVLTVADKKASVRYAVCELPVARGFGGRAFKLTKTTGEHYCVRVNGEHDSTCDCAGFTYARGKACKHVDAVAALLANGWLDELETVCDLAAEIEAKDAYYAARGI